MELVVQILNFGSAWWMRPGWDEQDPKRYTQHAAVFNSTGIWQGGKIHTDGPVHGLIRFNLSSGLNLRCTHDNIGRTFRFNPIEKYRETKRLLALGLAQGDVRPTHFLVCLNSTLHGTISHGTVMEGDTVSAIAISRFRGKQETLLLIASGVRIHTKLGIWHVARAENKLPRLALLDEPGDHLSKGKVDEIQKRLDLPQ